jgi:hypothetical protein
VEFFAPGGNDVHQSKHDVAPDGKAILFTDTRVAGNDLYLGRPEAGAATQQLLLDVADTDRLLSARFSGDGAFAVVALIEHAVNSSFLADRLLAVPLAGGAPITLDQRTDDAPAYFSTGAYSPQIAGDKLFYLKGYDDGQTGFYVLDLPRRSTGTGRL